MMQLLEKAGLLKLFHNFCGKPVEKLYKGFCNLSILFIKYPRCLRNVQNLFSIFSKASILVRLPAFCIADTLSWMLQIFNDRLRKGPCMAFRGFPEPLHYGAPDAFFGDFFGIDYIDVIAVKFDKVREKIGRRLAEVPRRRKDPDMLCVRVWVRFLEGQVG